MCPQSTGRGQNFTRKMPLDLFESVLDQVVAKYGTPIINLEGSGEPTLAKDLPEYIEACTRRGLKSFMYCNGTNLTGDFLNDVVVAGIDFIRFSCIGYTPALYKQWMSQDRFYEIRDNAIETKQCIQRHRSACELSSYHLILDNSQIDYEIEQYKTAFIDSVGCIGYIWKMHNWSGNYQPLYLRNPEKRKTCGRPFAPELTVRAGGLDGKQGAVTPCCQTMGPPNEALSVLGHFEDQSFEDIYWGDEYEQLRSAHREGRFDDIEYCKNCDFLYDDPEVLVWSNDPTASVNYMLGTGFKLSEYQ